MLSKRDICLEKIYIRSQIVFQERRALFRRENEARIKFHNICFR